MQMLNPYVHFNGQCEEAFNFHAEVLGGEIVAMMTYKGTPAEEQTPAGWHNKIIHARLMVGDKMLMGSDAPPERFDLGTVRVPIAETFFAERFGMVADLFGTPWMILCEKGA